MHTVQPYNVFVYCEQKHKTQFCLPRNEHCKALTCWHMCAQNTVSCCSGPPKNHNYSYNCTMSVMSRGVFSKHKTQLAVLINSEMGAATCCAQKHSNYWCQNTTDLPSPDEHCNASMCLHVGRPKDHLASVPRSHFELHTAQFASPISHASLHMCTRAHTRTVYAHRKLNGGNYTEFILPGCAFKCKLFAANFSF